MSEASPVVLITGASGFVGSHLVDTFRARGFTVRAQVRARSSRRWLTQGDGAPLPGVTLVDGDITEPASLPAAVRGADVVVHCAGLVDHRDGPQLARINHHGSENLAHAVREAIAAGDGPRRLVNVSSLAVSGASVDGAPRREDDEPRPINEYGRTKLAGERACLALRDLCQVASIRPPAIYGPRDVAFLAMIRLLQLHLRPVTGVLGPRRRISIAHVADVCEAVWLGATHPAADGAYFVSDTVLHPFEDVTGALAEALGVWTLAMPLVPFVVSGAWRVSSVWERLTGRTGLVTREQAEQLLAGEWIVSTDRLVRELGFAPQRTLAGGWRETIDWYRGEGWIR